MKVLVDMNMSPRWANVLAEAGYSAIHWSKLGRADTPDPEIMAFAAANGYVVFTNDLDFGEILAETNASSPSVMQVRVGNLRTEAIGLKVIAALKHLRTHSSRALWFQSIPGRRGCGYCRSIVAGSVGFSRKPASLSIPFVRHLFARE